MAKNYDLLVSMATVARVEAWWLGLIQEKLLSSFPPFGGMGAVFGGFRSHLILSWVVVLMNCLLQHPTTGLFLAPDFSWTEEEGEACTFGSAACALRFCATYAVSPVQIVVGFSARR